MGNAEIDSVFGGPLSPDPAVALRTDSFTFPTPKAGPLPKVQFLVEIVGPRCIASSSALAVLDEPWRSALGDPEVFVMSPADSNWRRPVRPDVANSYDSLALAWDYLAPRGALSTSAANRLVLTAESFAQSIQRPAMPMPLPDAVDRVGHLGLGGADHLFP